MLHRSRRMGSSNRPWNSLGLSTTGLSTHKARRASAGWGAAEQLACQSRGPPPATRKAVFPVPGPATRDPNRGVTNRWRAGWSRPDQPKHRLGHSGDPDLLDGGVDRSSSGRPALCRTHQRSTYQERIVQAHLTALAESGTPVKDQADQATANPRALPGDSAQIER